MENNTSLSTHPAEERFTLEKLEAMKLAKREDILKSKEVLFQLTQQIMEPRKTYSKVDTTLNYVKTGFAVYDGVRTGVKLWARIRSLFKPIR